MDFHSGVYGSPVLPGGVDVKRLCIAGTRCQLFVLKTVSTVWANLTLKRWDAVLVKMKDSFL